MNIKKWGLVGIVAGILSFSSCGYNDTVKLPNNYVVENVRRETRADYRGNIVFDYNECSRKLEKLIDKSRVNGVISYIGFLKTNDKTISVNNVNLNQENIAGSGGILLSDGGDAKGENNVTLFDHGGIIIKFKPIEKCQEDNYILQLKTQGNEISPAIALEEYKKGDTISIPTIKEIPLEGDPLYFRCRTLNKLDYLYLQDIKKVK